MLTKALYLNRSTFSTGGAAVLLNAIGQLDASHRFDGFSTDFFGVGPLDAPEEVPAGGSGSRRYPLDMNQPGRASRGHR